MRKQLALWIAALGVVFSVGCASRSTRQECAAFVASRVSAVEPVTARANLVYWDAATTGKPDKFDEYAQLQLQIRRMYSDPNDFARLKAFRKARLGNPRLARQVDKLYYAYLQNQIEPHLLQQIVELETKVQEAYNNYRGTVGDRQITMSDIYTIMTTEKDVARREAAWRASRQVGDVIVDDFLRLVRLRNQAARKLGFDNFHTMTVVAGEQDVGELDTIFDDLDRLTREPFARMKKELDGILAKGYGISPDELMPWHYHDPFFQRTPLVYDVDLDAYYKRRDVKELTRRFYDGVGLPIEDILDDSDLYYREGKYPHAFSHDVDRKGDVRVLANLQDTERWMETLLHEVGHAIYDRYHDPNEPWLLREPAHPFTTEAIAMLFGRLSRNAAWMQQMLGLSDEETAKIAKVSSRYLRFQQVLFVRWALVMYHFERALYANPDQDLNTLWWDLVEKYQLVRRPPGPADAGWLSKLHFTTAPCYYHNYVLGELLASQLHYYIVHHVLGLESDAGVSYVGDRRVGRYLREKVFGPGALYPWNEMIRRATGEPLTPKYFVEQFVK
jgi:peptidyl-dipeptidase A